MLSAHWSPYIRSRHCAINEELTTKIRCSLQTFIPCVMLTASIAPKSTLLNRGNTNHHSKNLLAKSGIFDYWKYKHSLWVKRHHALSITCLCDDDGISIELQSNVQTDWAYNQGCKNNPVIRAKSYNFMVRSCQEIYLNRPPIYIHFMPDTGSLLERRQESKSCLCFKNMRWCRKVIYCKVFGCTPGQRYPSVLSYSPTAFAFIRKYLTTLHPLVLCNAQLNP